MNITSSEFSEIIQHRHLSVCLAPGTCTKMVTIRVTVVIHLPVNNLRTTTSLLYLSPHLPRPSVELSRQEASGNVDEWSKELKKPSELWGLTP